MQFSCFVNHKNDKSISKRCQQEYHHVDREPKNSKTQRFRDEDHASWGCSCPIGVISWRIIHFVR